MRWVLIGMLLLGAFPLSADPLVPVGKAVVRPDDRQRQSGNLPVGERRPSAPDTRFGALLWPATGLSAIAGSDRTSGIRARPLQPIPLPGTVILIGPGWGVLPAPPAWGGVIPIVSGGGAYPPVAGPILPPAGVAYSNPAARYSSRLHTDTDKREPSALPFQELLVEGKAPVRDGDTVAARQAALQNALLQALEKGVGTPLSPALRSELLPPTQQHERVVVPAKILEEKVEEGTLTVKVLAQVNRDLLRKRVRELGLTRRWKIAVAIREGKENALPNAASLAASEILALLLQAGFSATHQRAEDVPASTADLLAALRADKRAPAADLLLVGSAASRLAASLPVTVFGQTAGTIPLYQGEVEVQAIWVQSGEVASARSAQETTSDSIASVAACSALQASARRVAQGLLEDLLVLPTSGICSVQVEGVGFQHLAQARSFEETLRRLPGVRGVRRREYADGRLLLDVECDSERVDTLGSDLENAGEMKAFGLTVEADTRTRIRVRLALGGNKEVPAK